LFYARTDPELSSLFHEGGFPVPEEHGTKGNELASEIEFDCKKSGDYRINKIFPGT